MGKQWIATVTLVGMMASDAAMANDARHLLSECEIANQAAGLHKDKPGLEAYEQLETGLCLGLIQGVRETMISYEYLLPKEQRLCIPEGTTNGEVMSLVVKYLKDHPDSSKLSETPMVMAAYLHSFPCK
jgi:hypothetical protein